jgi:lipopolysaccharide export system protein LptC
MFSPTDQVRDNTDRMFQAASRRARLAPLFSLIAACIGLGFVLLFVIQFGGFSVFFSTEKPVEFAVEKPEQITGGNARIAGFDKEQQPYEITAQKGFQDKENPDIAHLETVVGNFKKKTGEIVQITSQKAAYQAKTKQMDMQGDVKIVQVGRFTATMDKAHVDMQTKDLVSDTSVVVDMAGGTIHANGMKISNDGKTIVFLNGVKARLEDASQKGDEKP